MKSRYLTVKSAIILGVAATSLSAGSANATTIILNDIGGVTGSPAEQGFLIAASYWSRILTNDVTINLDVGFAPLNPGVIGSTGSRRADISVANFENLLGTSRSGSTIDQTAVVPALTNGGFSGLTNGVDASGNNDTNVIVPIDGKTSSQVLFANSSVIKAVGGAISNPGMADGTINFSSNFGFDFDPTDGIDANTFDFIGVAIHEIGHALGFVSGVDFLDVFGGPNGPNAGQLGYDLNDTSIFSSLDLFRYSAPGVIDLTVGTESYFSIDGGVTALFGNTFSTGRFNGDGNQASHWVDATGANACGPQIGIMDPTFCFGQTGVVTGLDLSAFDAFGWNLSVDALNYQDKSTADIFRDFNDVGAVPEPSVWAMLIAGFGLIGSQMRRGRRSTKKTGKLATA